MKAMPVPGLSGWRRAIRNSRFTPASAIPASLAANAPGASGISTDHTSTFLADSDMGHLLHLRGGGVKAAASGPQRRTDSLRTPPTKILVRALCGLQVSSPLRAFQ